MSLELCHACISAVQAAAQGGHKGPSYVCRASVCSRDCTLEEGEENTPSSRAAAREGGKGRVGVLGMLSAGKTGMGGEVAAFASSPSAVAMESAVRDSYLDPTLILPLLAV